MKYSWIMVAALAAVGCGKKKSNDTAAPPAGSAVAEPSGSGSAVVEAAGSGSAAAGSAAAPAAALPPDADDVLNLANGALIVDEPEGVDSSHPAWMMLDSDPKSDWGVEKDVILKHPFVIEIGGRAQIDSFVVDAGSIQLPERLPGKIKIEVSDKSAKDGFTTVAEAELKQPAADGMKISVAKPVPGRFVRVTFYDANPDDTTQQDIANLHGYGKWLAVDPTPNITGSYQTNQGVLNLTQTGSNIVGCRENAAAPILGGIDGRVAKMNWPDNGDGFEGPAIAVFSKDKTFMGYWATKLETPTLGPIEIEKKLSDKPGKCPSDKKDPIAEGLEKGRVRLYGINFDTDSDKLKDNSKATLDAVKKVLDDHKDWKITIEGHTDSSSTHEHNQPLSEKRAAAVKAYLVTAGIAADRLQTAGFAETKPIAPNTDALGRSQNRRVELVKN